MGSLTKLVAALSPLLAAALTQLGIKITEAEVAVWVELAMWLIALLAMIFPSVRAWVNHREDAQ